MTTFATRPPLQQLDNPHVMSQRGNGRRTSARLAEKEDAPTTDVYTVDPVERSQLTTEGEHSKGSAESTGAKTGRKRKPGECGG